MKHRNGDIFTAVDKYEKWTLRREEIGYKPTTRSCKEEKSYTQWRKKLYIPKNTTQIIKKIAHIKQFIRIVRMGRGPEIDENNDSKRAKAEWVCFYFLYYFQLQERP